MKMNTKQTNTAVLRKKSPQMDFVWTSVLPPIHTGQSIVICIPAYEC